MEPSHEQEPENHLERGAVDLVLLAFQNHKDHARHQEAHRARYLLAYFSVSSVAFAAILNVIVKYREISDPIRDTFLLVLLALIIIGFITGAASVKTGVEFQRHFRQAEKIIDNFRAELEGRAVASLLKYASLGTASHDNQNISKAVARNFSIAALHNYTIALFIGFEGAVAAILINASPYIVAFVFLFLWLFAVSISRLHWRAIYQES